MTGRMRRSLLETVSLMKRRLRLVQDITGKRNAWNAPITEAMPIHVTILDECQRFLDLAAVKGDKDAEKLVQECNALSFRRSSAWAAACSWSLSC